MGFLQALLNPKAAFRAMRNYDAHRFYLYEAGRPSRARKSAAGYFSGPEDTTETAQRLHIIREARELEEDFPIATMILDAFDIYAFGSIRYQPMTGDTGYNKEILGWLQYWMDNCDYTGRFDLQTLVQLAHRGKKRDGESGFVHVDPGNDYKIQLISGEKIGNPTSITGFSEDNLNGIRVDKFGRVLSYDIYKRTRNSSSYIFDVNIPASDFSHVFDPFRVDNYHGVSVFKSVITRMRDMKETLDYSRINIKYRSSQMPFYKTEDGVAPDTPGAAMRDNIGPLRDEYGVSLERVEGGEQQFLKTTEGIFEYPNDFPNQQFAPVMDHFVKEIFSGVGLSYHLNWDIGKMTGTVGRLIVEREDRRMKLERTRMEHQALKMIIKRAIQSGIKQKAISKDRAEKFEGQFFYGARISADYGRDAKADAELVAAGHLTEAEYQHIHGRNPELVRSVRLQETMDLIEDAQKVSDASGIQLENAVNLIRKQYMNPPLAQSKSDNNPDMEDGDGNGAVEATVDPLITKIGVGGSQAMTEVVKAYGEGTISRDAAKVMLVDVLGLSIEKANEMLDGSTISPISDDPETENETESQNQVDENGE